MKFMKKSWRSCKKEMYIQAFIAYEEIKARVAVQENAKEGKGALVQKKHIRKKEGKTYCYTYSYLQFSEYTDGKRKVKRKYIPKEDLPQVMEQLHSQQAETPQTQAALQQRQAMLKECEKQLQKYIRKELLPPMQILRQEATQCYTQQMQVVAYRQKQVKHAKENPNYKIRTEAGELVISKNECTIAKSHIFTKSL